MYASLHTSHFSLRDNFRAEIHDQNGGYIVVCHVSDHLYLSLKTDEARRFAEALLEAADNADAAQERLDALKPLAQEASV